MTDGLRFDEMRPDPECPNLHEGQHTCGTCYGSGGGPDPALACRACGGTGECRDCDTIPTAIGEFSDPEGLREGVGTLRQIYSWSESRKVFKAADQAHLGNETEIRDKILHLVLGEGGPDPECEGCGGGGSIAVPIGEHFVSHDMALDAGEPAMEGMSMGVEWGQEPCPCHRPGLTGEQALEILRPTNFDVWGPAPQEGCERCGEKLVHKWLCGLTLEIDCRADGCSGGYLIPGEGLVADEPCPTCGALRGVT
jgi:hypothetical protein